MKWHKKLQYSILIGALIIWSLQFFYSLDLTLFLTFFSLFSLVFAFEIQTITTYFDFFIEKQLFINKLITLWKSKLANQVDDATGRWIKLWYPKGVRSPDLNSF